MARRTPPFVIAAAAALLIATLLIPGASALPPPVPPPPAAATRVHVQAGKLTSGIAVAMRRTAFGAISGRVVERGSAQPLKTLQVVAYSPSLQLDRRAYTDSAGKYVLHLPASARGYAICFRDSHKVPQAHGGTSKTGWTPQCFPRRVWSGVSTSVPATAGRVRVTKGHETTDVNARMQPGGAITGRVTHDGHGVRADLYVHSVGAPRYRNAFSTDGFGRYRVVGLPPAPGGYQVCFDTRNGEGGPGTVPRCHGSATDWRPPKLDSDGNAAWPAVHWPKGATHIHVRPGSVRAGIGAHVRRAGAITGHIVDRATGARVDDPDVSVYDRHGRFVGSADAFGGRFKVANLPSAATDYVCAFPQRYNALFLQNGRPDSYQRGCYRDSRWTGRHSRTAGTSLRVVRGKTRTDVVVALRPASMIRGRVTSARNGDPVLGRVYLFSSSGRLLASESTADLDLLGEYQFMGLPASRSGYLVCANAIRRKQLDKPWLRPQCFGHARWDGANAAPSTKARPIRVGAGVHRHGLDIVLHAGGAMSGRVTKADTGRPLHNTRLFVIDDMGRHVVQTEVSFDGTWSVEGLDPARSYRICFANFPRSWKYQPTCYPDVRWYRPWATRE